MCSSSQPFDGARSALPPSLEFFARSPLILDAASARLLLRNDFIATPTEQIVKKSKNTSGDTSNLEGRLAWLMEKLWRGSQTAMASDLGVTQGTIANILAGRRKPGRSLLSTLAGHPLINSDWLLDGVGSPIVLEATGAGGEAALPIARKLFAGLPDDHPDCLAEVLHPVSRRLYRRSRYWIHTDGPEHPFARTPKSPIQAGDWVLMEPDSGNWPDDLRGRLCLSQVVSSDGDLLFCCRNDAATNGCGTTIDFDFLDQLPPEIEDAKALYHEGRLKRGFPSAAEPAACPGQARRLPVQVVAVAIHRCGDL
jgi:transcriptional regulator with XRE-family HTH domain